MTTTEPLSTTAATAVTARQMSIVCEALGVHSYVDVMIADRCRKPTGDLLSQLIALEVDGEELTVDDIRTFVAALVSDAD
jgi:cytochrome P450